MFSAQWHKSYVDIGGWCLPRWRCRQRRSMRCLAVVIGESGFEAQAGQIIVSGYSSVCFEIKFSGRHRGFDGVLFNL